MEPIFHHQIPDNKIPSTTLAIASGIQEFLHIHYPHTKTHKLNIHCLHGIDQFATQISLELKEHIIIEINSENITIYTLKNLVKELKEPEESGNQYSIKIELSNPNFLEFIYQTIQKLNNEQ